MRLHHIFIDITSGNNDIEIGFRAFTNSLKVVLATLSARTDALQTLVDNGLKSSFDAARIAGYHAGDIEFVVCYLFGYLLGRFARINHCIRNEEQCAIRQHALIFERIHNHVWEGYAIVIHSIDSHQSAERTFYCYRSVLLYERLHISSDGAGIAASLLHFRKV